MGRSISEGFHREKLSHLPIQPLQDLLRIECADRQLLPYCGYISAEISASGVGLEEEERSQSCLLLVVPESSYNSQVPLLLGTNILEQFLDSTRERNGVKFLQTAKLLTPWYLSFRCMVLREKELERNGNRLGLVKSAETKNVVVKPNSTVIIAGEVDHAISYKPTCALLQPVKNNKVTSLLDIGPTLVNYESRRSGYVDPPPVKCNHSDCRRPSSCGSL